jgi:hypothetical protein
VSGWSPVVVEAGQGVVPLPRTSAPLPSLIAGSGLPLALPARPAPCPACLALAPAEGRVWAAPPQGVAPFMASQWMGMGADGRPPVRLDTNIEHRHRHEHRHGPPNVTGRDRCPPNRLAGPLPRVRPY